LQREVDHQVLCGLDHMAVVQPAACAASRSGVTPCPAITSPTNIDELSNAASTGERVIVLHAHGGRVVHQITAGGIRRPGAHRPWPRSLSSLSSMQTRESSASWMMGSRTPACKSSMAIALPAPPAPTRRARAPSGWAPWVFLRIHKSEPVEHVAVPGPVRIAADDAHDPQHLGPFRARGAVGGGSELVWHGDEDPVHVPRGRQPRHDGVEVIG
jgi:hypothetical protein